MNFAIRERSYACGYHYCNCIVQLPLLKFSLHWNSCLFDQIWFYSLKWKYHLEFYDYFFKFINNTKRCLRARSQDFLPIGSQENKFIFRNQNFLNFFKNFYKRKLHEFPKFWGNFQKFILRNKEFSLHTKVYTHNFLRKLCTLWANNPTNTIKFYGKWNSLFTEV